MNIINDKTLVMIVGPTAVGKSTLMNEVVRLDRRFARTRSFTTRPARSNDEPGHYIYLTQDELDNKIRNNEVITDVVSPATGYHYGTVSKSYIGEYNLLDTFAHSVDEYRVLPFKQTITVSLTTDADDWKSWLLARFPQGGQEMNDRLQEAISSIEWSMSQNDNHYWLVNSNGDLEASARRLIEIVTKPGSTADTPPQAEQLHATAKHLLSYEQERGD